MKTKFFYLLIWLVVLISVPLSVFGVLMQGTNYQLTTDTIDSSGGKVSKGTSPAPVTALHFSAGQSLVISVSTSTTRRGNWGYLYSIYTSTEPPETDTTPPCAISNLTAISGTNEGEIQLSWTAPGDDGTSGIASFYTVKCSSNNNIDNDTAFNTAADLVTFSTSPIPTPLVAGTLQSFTVKYLVPGATYYFAMKARDNMSLTGLWSRNVGLQVNATNYAMAYKDTVSPTAITNLTALATTNEGELRLNWTAPGDDGMTGTATAYTIKCSTVNNIADDTAFNATTDLVNFSSSTIPNPILGGSQQSFVVTGLIPAVTYYFAIKARDEVGLSPAWIRSTGINENNWACVYDAKPPAITSLTALPYDRYIILQWTPVSVFDFDYYKIYSSTDGSIYSVIYTTTSTTYLHPNLTNGTTYIYYIGTVDQGPLVLESVPSISTSTYPRRETPQSPSGFVGTAISSTTIRWVWQDKSTTETEFRIYDSTFATTGLIQQIGADITTWYQSGLTANINSNVRSISAYNEMGESGLIAATTYYPITAYPIYTLANPPESLVVTGVTPSQVSLSWGTNNNSVGTQYGVAYSSVSSFVSSVTYRTDIAQDNVIVPGLSVSTSYWFRVWAYNGNRITSAFSNIIDTVTLFAYPPVAVTDLKIELIWGTSVQLSWTAPGENGTVGNIVNGNYRIKYMVSSSGINDEIQWGSASGDVQWSTSTIPGNREMRIIISLTAKTTYSFALKTQDAETSWSALSNTVVGTTLDTAPPGEVLNFSAQPSTATPKVTLSWTNPSDTDFVGRLIVYRTDRPPNSRTDGTPIVTGNGTRNALETFEHVSGLVWNTSYYYVAYTYDDVGNYSAGTGTMTYLVEISTPPPPPPPDSTMPRAVLGLWGSLNAKTVFNLYWSSVTLNTNGTPANDLVGYKVYKGNDVDSCNTFVSPIIYSTASPPGGLYSFSEYYSSYQTWYYRVATFDSSGNENSYVTYYIDNTDNVNLYAISIDSNIAVVVPKSISKKLRKEGSLGKDLAINFRKLTSLPSGMTNGYNIYVASATDGEEIKGFTFDGGSPDIMVSYNVTGGNVDGLNVPASQASQRLAIHRDNGVEWIKLGGKVDTANQFVGIKYPVLGKYGLGRTENPTQLQVNKIVPRIFAPDYPDPDGVRNKIRFYLDNPNKSVVKGKVIDMSGTVIKEDLPVEDTGTMTIVLWDGKTKDGKIAHSGVYIYQLEADGKVVTGTFVLAR